jgi:hypothetical protein
MNIPPLNTFYVETLDVWLVDQRYVAHGQEKEARGILKQVLEDVTLNTVRPSARLCGMEQSEHENQLFLEARQQDPEITFDEFVEEAGDEIALDDSSSDPRLGVLVFLVVSGNLQEVLGSFTLYNLSFTQAPGVTTASAMAMPGCVAAPGHSLRETWSSVMMWILENNLTSALSPGALIDIDEWRFPTRPEHQWLLSAEEQLLAGDEEGDAVGGRVVEDLSAVHDLTTVAGVPVSVRRRLDP